MLKTLELILKVMVMVMVCMFSWTFCPGAVFQRLYTPILGEMLWCTAIPTSRMCHLLCCENIHNLILSVFVVRNSSVHCTLSLRSVENLEYGMLLCCTSLEYCWFFKNSCSENYLFVSFSFLFSFFFFKTLITICRIWTSWTL